MFYVGKGKGNRINQTQKSKRNKFFIRYINKYECAARIIKDDLTEEDALLLENQIIISYKETDQCCCNMDNGGRNGGCAFAENNGMYGKTHTDDVKALISKINSDGRHKGENNSQYGISPKDRMCPETYNGWKLKQLNRKHGESNPNFGNHILHQRYSTDKVLSKEKQSRPKSKNGRAQKISMYDEKMKNEIKFDCIKDCAEYLIENNLTRSKNPDIIYQGIWAAKRKNKLRYDHYFVY